MSDRFDFEQQIQKCWIVTDDLEELSEAIMEGKYVKYQDKDEICNALNGLSSMYNLKFNKLWDLFEDVHMKLVRDEKMLSEELAAMRQQHNQGCGEYGCGAGKNCESGGAGNPNFKPVPIISGTKK